MDSRINTHRGQNFQDTFSLTTHTMESVLPEDTSCVLLLISFINILKL